MNNPLLWLPVVSALIAATAVTMAAWAARRQAERTAQVSSTTVVTAASIVDGTAFRGELWTEIRQLRAQLTEVTDTLEAVREENRALRTAAALVAHCPAEVERLQKELSLERAVTHELRIDVNTLRARFAALDMPEPRPDAGI